ncbi:testican-2-like [Octopus vulgaris]|uniref:Testican-2-like n=1 Tax=Octopus vulgaris TaxID=6645 RepID=A0AA36F0K3_OCTVU|nr:testican-2-like [Octopus vulgaris]
MHHIQQLCLLMTIWSASVVMAESFKRSLTARHHHHHHHHQHQQQQQQQNLPVVFAVADRKNEVKPDHYDGVQLLSVHEKDPLSSADGQENKEEKDDIITSRSSLKKNLSPSQPVRELKHSDGNEPSGLSSSKLENSIDCPNGCQKFHICFENAQGNHCIEKPQSKDSLTFLKRLQATNNLQLNSLAVDESPRRNNLPTEKKLELSSNHVFPYFNTNEEGMSYDDENSQDELESDMMKDDLNQTNDSEVYSNNKPQNDSKSVILPARGHHTNLVSYFMSLRKGNKMHKKPHKNYECDHEQLEDIMKRLTGWFVLLHAKFKESRKKTVNGPVYQIPSYNLHHAVNKTKHHFSVKKELNSFYKSRKCHCVRSIIWEFKRLDFDGDKHITKKELSKIENNQMEPCVEPFMDSCDRNHDSKLTRHEWCCCFAAVRPPCFSHLRRLRSDAVMKSGKIKIFFLYNSF